jgi:hypothetical protein
MIGSEGEWNNVTHSETNRNELLTENFQRTLLQKEEGENGMWGCKMRLNMKHAACSNLKEDIHKPCISFYVAVA